MPADVYANFYFNSLYEQLTFFVHAESQAFFEPTMAATVPFHLKIIK
jgi:hypothetical protein